MASDKDAKAAMAADLLAGLTAMPKTISSRWLYDRRGSHLFEQITDLEEYYPTRTELGIFDDHAEEMAAALGPDVVLVEYGAGALVKTRLLLDALTRPRAYVPIDISGPFLRDAAGALQAEYPALEVHPVVADFTRPVDLSDVPGARGERVGFFPGSTIGNLENSEITAFFRAARTSLGPRAKFLLGVDLKKDPAILVPAYDDAQGVTAAFNLNLLERFNRELEAGFEIEAFAHEARWNADESRIEMHLAVLRDTTAQIDGQSIYFTKGETIRTEISRKFELDALDRLLAPTDWTRSATWQDENGYFALVLLN
ncbi:MAG: L-histidine N(alpha)-methyltransferase [Hyphomonadaceae bacterium]|nr:L-histidine N(alpha)-methyltransferase [Hyphomonadaceae bacterium]